MKVTLKSVVDEPTTVSNKILKNWMICWKYSLDVLLGCVTNNALFILMRRRKRKNTKNRKSHGGEDWAIIMDELLVPWKAPIMGT